MWDSDSFSRHSFQADLKNGGGLCMSCPGDACGIHPSDWYDVGKESGYRFSCHNTDNYMQQLTLLSGLACLHDLARKAGV